MINDFCRGTNEGSVVYIFGKNKYRYAQDNSFIGHPIGVHSQRKWFCWCLYFQLMSCSVTYFHVGYIYDTQVNISNIIIYSQVISHVLRVAYEVIKTKTVSRIIFQKLGFKKSFTMNTIFIILLLIKTLQLNKCTTLIISSEQVTKTNVDITASLCSLYLRVTVVHEWLTARKKVYLQILISNIITFSTQKSREIFYSKKLQKQLYDFTL